MAEVSSERSAGAPAGTSAHPWVLRLLVAALGVGLVGCDHATKLAAACSLADGRATPVLGDFVEFRLAQNPDTAFSLFGRLGLPHGAPLLAGLSVVALAAITGLWIARRRRALLVEHVGFAIVIAGALGNVIDRILRGHVIDFIHVKHWPVFNVADIAIVLGMAILAFARGARDRPTKT